MIKPGEEIHFGNGRRVLDAVPFEDGSRFVALLQVEAA